MPRSMVSVDDARALVLERVAPLEAVEIDAWQAERLVLARDCHARWDLPICDVSVMDGYAVRSTDLDGAAELHVQLRQVGESAAGHPLERAVGAGETARISTGAAIPPGADAVVAQEDTIARGDTIEIDRTRLHGFGPGKFVRPAGSDVRSAERLLAAGTRLSLGDIALVCASGHDVLSVHRRPRVAVLSTGDELVPPGTEPGAGQVISTNGRMLAAQAAALGATPHVLADVGDRPADLARAFAEGLEADVLLTSGGISVGDHDLVAETIEQASGDIVFRGMQVRPGKPTTFAMVGTTPVFALPGNPASSLVAFELVVRPALLGLLGLQDRRKPHPVVLEADAVGLRSRPHYVRARVSHGRALPLNDQLSGNLRSISRFNALLIVPAGVERIARGARIDAIVLDADAELGLDPEGDS